MVQPGGIETAFDEVLSQFAKKRQSLIYKVEDDLIALVRSLFLLYHSKAASELHKLGKISSANQELLEENHG